MRQHRPGLRQAAVVSGIFSLCEEKMDQRTITHGWHGMCENHKGYLVTTVGLMRSPELVQIVRGISANFLELAAPASEDEWMQRQWQQQGVSSIIAAIANSDTNLRFQPYRAAAVLEKSKQLAALPFPSNQKEAAILTVQILAFNAM